MTIQSFLKTIRNNHPGVIAKNETNHIIINIPNEKLSVISHNPNYKGMSIVIYKKRRTDLDKVNILHGYSPYVSAYYSNFDDEICHYSICIKQPYSDLLTKQIENKNYLEALDIILAVITELVS